jgi:hypothetical protein
VQVSPLASGRYRREQSQIVVVPPRPRRGGTTGTVAVHVTTYSYDASPMLEGAAAPLFLCVVLAPHAGRDLLGGWQASGLPHLVEELLPPLPGGETAARALRATFVLINSESYSPDSGDVWNSPQAEAYEVFTTTTSEELHDAALCLRADLSAAEISRAVGHPLPWWPNGCATAELVAAWDPRTGPVPCPVPPPLRIAWRVRGWTHHFAESLPPAQKQAVKATADTMWGSMLHRFRGRDQLTAPTWTPALAISSAVPAQPGGPYVAGLAILLDNDDADLQHCDFLRNYFGDPHFASAGTIALNQLTPDLQSTITAALAPAPTGAGRSWRSTHLRRQLDQTAESATWQIPGNNDIPAAIHDGRVAFLVPRAALRLPTDLASTGAELIIIPGSADQVGDQLSALLHLDDTTVIPIAAGTPALVAGTLAWRIWHSQEALHLDTEGLVAFGLNTRALHQTINATMSAQTPTALPWAAAVALAGNHPSACCIPAPAQV